MKRINRARKAAVAAALAVATGMATALGAPAASAQSPAASIDLSNGSSLETHNGEDLARVAMDLLRAADGVVSEGIVPSLEQTTDGLNIVLDPNTVPGLGEAFAPEETTTVSPVEGTTAQGEKVMFPTSGEITSTYGTRWNQKHNGLDIGADLGTPIYAAMGGEVINAGPAQGFGNWVRIQHDDGSIAVYGHMNASTIQVTPGQRVEAGQQIAAVGNEGQSTGPHLHFELWQGGAASDPTAWFNAAGITV